MHNQGTRRDETAESSPNPPRDLLSTKISKLNQIVQNSNHLSMTYSRLQTDYIDLLLMNYADINGQHVQRWKAMISLKNRNKVE